MTTTPTTTTLAEEIDRVAADTGFSGVVRVDRGDVTELAVAHGMADRRWAIPNTVDTRFGLASVAKGFTALVVASLVDDGTLGVVDDGPIGARRGPPAHRRCRHRRAADGPPVRHRRLPRRGRAWTTSPTTC